MELVSNVNQVFTEIIVIQSADSVALENVTRKPAYVRLTMFVEQGFGICFAIKDACMKIAIHVSKEMASVRRVM
jgi:hypothetical protein